MHTGQLFHAYLLRLDYGDYKFCGANKVLYKVWYDHGLVQSVHIECDYDLKVLYI